MDIPQELENLDIDWLGHASVRIRDSDGFTVYVDPWGEVMREEEERDADVIISTHDHHDHFDVKAIQSLKRPGTILVCSETSEGEVPEDVSHKVLRPNRVVKAHDLQVRGLHAYNVNKFRSPDEPFHPRGEGLGVLFEVEGIKFYHAGDTDPIEEMEELSDEDIDVAFIPVGGKYTMDQEEAIEAINSVNPRYVVPIHYGSVEGTTADIERFAEDVRENTGAEPLVLGRSTV